MSVGRSAAADETPTLVLLDGQRIAARLVGLEGENQWLIEDANGRRAVAFADVFSWGERRDTGSRPALLLPQGGALVVEQAWISGTEVVVPESPVGLWREAKLPRSNVRGWLLAPPASAMGRDQITHNVATHKGLQDQVWLEKGDVITGLLLPQILLAGPKSQEEVDEPRPKFQLRTKAGEVTLPEEQITAIALQGAGAADRPRGLRWQLGFRDGSCLVVQKLQRIGGTMQVALDGGGSLTADAESFWSDLVFAQSFGPQVVYVSDLSALGFKHIPFLAAEWSYATDRSVVGGALRHRGKLFSKGLGMHSTSRLAYDVGGNYRWFQTDLAIDDTAGTNGSVVFRVLADRGKNDWQVAYESPVIRGGTTSIPISVDVVGVERLALIVEFADRGDELDYADWLNARLVP